MKQKILTYIQEEIINDVSLSLSTDNDLLNSGILDSISIMKLVAFLEMTFNIKIPNEDLLIENFVSIDAIIAFLSNKQVDV